jgi:hypothetical protein
MTTGMGTLERMTGKETPEIMTGIQENLSQVLVLGSTMITIMETGGIVGIQATVSGMEERRSTTFVRTIMVSGKICFYNDHTSF